MNKLVDKLHRLGVQPGRGKELTDTVYFYSKHKPLNLQVYLLSSLITGEREAPKPKCLGEEDMG